MPTLADGWRARFERKQGVNMPRDYIANPASSAARAVLDTKTLDAAGGDEQLPPLAPDGIEVEENASPRDELPTMEELEVARDNLSKKIAAEGADKKD